MFTTKKKSCWKLKKNKKHHNLHNQDYDHDLHQVCLFTVEEEEILFEAEKEQEAVWGRRQA